MEACVYVTKVVPVKFTNFPS